jgi:hypothetical protein
MTLKSKVEKLLLALFLIAISLVLISCGGPSQPTGSTRNPASDHKITESGSDQNQADNTASPAKSGAGQITDEQVFQYLNQKVPELNGFDQGIKEYNQINQTHSRLIMRVDAVPNPQATDLLKRDYYYVYVGSDMEDTVSQWNGFYVKKDLTEIMVEDLTGGAPLTLNQWRNIVM